MNDFIFKPFEKMTDEDYARIGFKSGLEIHQQLLTDKKLFCRCPARKYTKQYDAEILRHMRPTLSELGEYDGTALMEFKTKKDIIYRIKRESVCTYEMDDTPPFLINEDALDIALQTGMLFNCKIVDELHIARKQYLDGSIPTGFQRTAIYALDGFVPYKNRNVEIIQMSIEEDACREVSDVGHTRIYVTDRLGMPLIETVTGPDMLTPNEAADIAVICSKVVRSTGKVRRGIGAAREDVNVSVKGGTRIEIKGVPRIPDIPLLTYNEAMRQWNLLRLREELKKRGITADSFKADSFDITTLIKIPHYTPLREAVEEGLKIKCVVLRGFKDLLHWQTQTDTYFSREISDRVRVIACLTKIPNIIHSDSKGDTLTSFEWQKIKKASGSSDKDTMVIVWGDERDTETAVKEIIIRAREAAIGVPSETRQALSDGTNGFERILPGADRMYPDTDLPPHEITEERIQALRSSLPAQFWMREEKYKKLKVPADVLSELSISKFAAMFEDAVEKNIDPVFASVVLIHYPKRLKKEGVDISKINDDTFKQLFNFLAKGKIIKEAVYPLLIISSSRQLTEKELPQICTPEEIKRTISESISKFNSLNISVTEKKKNVLMGIVMKRLRGRVEGKIVAANINHILEEVE